MKFTKSTIFIFALLNSLLSFGQTDFSDYKKYEVKNVLKTQIIIDGPIDSIKAYFLEMEKQNAVQIANNRYQLFNDFQAFITEESAKKATSENPPNRWLYTHEGSLSSLWEVTFKPTKDQKTMMEFEMKNVLTNNNLKDYINEEFLTQDEIWKKLYEKQKLVSRGIIENLYEIYFRKKLLPDLLAVDFNTKEGFNNKSYKYNDLTPITKSKADVQFFKEVPAKGEKPGKKSIVVYDRNLNTVNLIELETGKTLWKKQLENSDNQNLNGFNIHQNTVYVATSNGYIYALSLQNGEIYWRTSPEKQSGKKNITQFFKQDLPVSDDYIYANYDGRVYKVNRYNGKIDWSQTIGGYGHYNYSFDKDHLYKTGILECFVIDKKNGKINKIINNTQENTFYAPHILNQENNVIYLSAGKLYAFDLTKDKMLWKYEKEAKHILEENNVLYANTEDLNLLAIDRKSGKIIWENKEIESASGEGKHINDIFLLKDDILMNIETENYSQKSKGKQLVFINKKDGSLNFINNFSDDVVSRPIISGNKIILLTPVKILTFDIATKEVTEQNADLSYLKIEKKTGSDYEHFVKLVD